MSKTAYHSELVTLSPVKLILKSGVIESKKKKGSYYVMATINGEERYINPENSGIMDFFDAHNGQTVTVCAEGRGDDATITLVGEELPRRSATSQEPPPRQAPPQEPAHNDPPRPQPEQRQQEHVPVAGMRATEVEYSFTQGLPNYCSEHIGIVVALEPGTKAADALEFARKFVHSQIQQVK